MSTHQNALFVCFGGLSNTGYISGLAGMEAVRRVGLKKAALFCLAGLPAGIKSVHDKARAAERIITVDGCPMNCAKKVVEQSGLPIDKSITLTSDAAIKKVPFPLDTEGEPREPLEYVDENDVGRAVQIILDVIG